MEDVVNIISTLGFPIAVACWAMIVSRKDKEWLQNTLNIKLDNISEGISKLTSSLERFEDVYKEVNK